MEIDALTLARWDQTWFRPFSYKSKKYVALTAEQRQRCIDFVKVTGLNPDLGQVVFLLNHNEVTNAFDLAIVVTVEAMRMMADQTGQHDGMEGPWWCGPDGTWVDVWTGQYPPKAAKVVIHRKGCRFGFPGIAYMNPKNTKGQWQTNAANMLAKQAEVQALCRAFSRTRLGSFSLGQLGEMAELEMQEDPLDEPTDDVAGEGAPSGESPGEPMPDGPKAPLGPSAPSRPVGPSGLAVSNQRWLDALLETLDDLGKDKAWCEGLCRHHLGRGVKELSPAEGDRLLQHLRKQHPVAVSSA